MTPFGLGGGRIVMSTAEEESASKTGAGTPSGATYKDRKEIECEGKLLYEGKMVFVLNPQIRK